MRKYYCHVCDKIDFYSHDREHFNWQEYATQEEIDRSEERRIGYVRLWWSGTLK